MPRSLFASEDRANHDEFLAIFATAEKKNGFPHTRALVLGSII